MAQYSDAQPEMCAVSITDLPSLRFLCTSGHGRIIGDDASGATVRLAIPSTSHAAVAGGETIHTTANHPWLTADRGWVQAGQLQVGEQIVTLNGSGGTVAWVHAVPGQADMYNLTVANDHTYAGTFAALAALGMRMQVGAGAPSVTLDVVARMRYNEIYLECCRRWPARGVTCGVGGCERSTGMFGGDWSDRPRAAFAGSGDYGPGGYEGWQPWARRERDEEPPWGPGGPGRPGGPWGMRPGAWMWRFARRFPFGPGMGPGGPGPRMFGRGDLKYALLDLLRERPKHGYEMIKDLEERSGGFYTPSAGAIYPTLQLLEDRGWVTVETLEGKKVYAISDEGRAALAEHQERAEAFGGPGPGFGGPGFGGHRHGGPFGRQMRPELRDLRHESMEVARLMRAAVLASGSDPERLQRLRQIVAHTRGELDAFLGQGGAPSAGQGPATPHEGPVDEV